MRSLRLEYLKLHTEDIHMFVTCIDCENIKFHEWVFSTGSTPEDLSRHDWKIVDWT